MSDRLVISAALAGSAPMKEQNPAVPYTPEEFAEEAYRCQEEGAAVVHIHARDPKTGVRSHKLEHFRDTCAAIHARCPGLILNITTSGRPNEPSGARSERVAVLKPDMASFNTNSMNFGYVDWKTGKVHSEFVYENSFETMITIGKVMREACTQPECEIFDFGGLYNVLFLRKQNLFRDPMHFQFVFGVAGGVPFDLFNLARMRDLLPEGASWSVCGVSRQQFQAGMTAAVNGGHIRVGLEDNVRMPDKSLAKGSWEQVRWAVQVTQLAGREVASPDEAREIFHVVSRG